MLSLLTICSLIAAPPKVVLDVRFEMIPNLAYQLDIVSTLFDRGRSDAYHNLWKEKFLLTKDDKAALEKWKTVRAKLSNQSMAETIKFPIAPVRLPFDNETKARLAGINASSVTDFGRRISQVMSKEDSKVLSGVMAHFAERFRVWWDAEAGEKGKTFQIQMQKLVVNSKVAESVASYVRFYQPEIADGAVIPFQLMYKPKLQGGGMSGEQIADTAVAEFAEGESPANRIDVIIHELCHYFFWKGSPKNHIQLQRDFLSINDPASIPSFNVMNEGLASTLGNGMLAEKFMTPESFKQYKDFDRSWYGNYSIDGASKATFEWLKEYIARGGKLFDSGFAKSYVEQIKKGMGDAVLSPQMQLLSAHYILGDGWNQEIFGILGNAIQTTYSSARMGNNVAKSILESKAESPYMSSIVVIKPKDLSNVASMIGLSQSDVKLIKSKLESDKSCGFAKRVNMASMSYVLIGDDNEKIGEMARKLGSSKVSVVGLF
jgi:hypothetical protein